MYGKEGGFTEAKLYDLLRSLHDCNKIKYAAYRTASKLRVLQKAFHLDQLTVDVIGNVFNQHRLTSTENSVHLTPSELETLLEDILFVVDKQRPADCPFDLNNTVALLDLFLRRLLNRQGIEVISIKVTLALLTGSRPRDKYRYLFNQMADHNNVITSRRIEFLLQRLILLPGFFGEGNSFGKALIPGSVKSCFPNDSNMMLGINFDEFLKWLAKDPQLLVWVSTLYRLQISTSVMHDVRCSACKDSIKGLRYRCLRCLSHNQCQTCFFEGRSLSNHKLTHLVQEYCSPSTTKQSTLALLATLKNRLKNSKWKMQYLPAEQHESYIHERTLNLQDILQDKSKDELLEKMIKELEEQTRMLCTEMEQSRTPDDIRRLLENHRQQIDSQIAKLNSIKNEKALAFSTPCTRFTRQQDNCTAISPIFQSDVTLTWDKNDLQDKYNESCILTLQDIDGLSSHAYTWLQASAPENDETQRRDLEADLDTILEKLQKLLSNDPPAPTATATNTIEKILDDIIA